MSDSYGFVRRIRRFKGRSAVSRATYALHRLIDEAILQGRIQANLEAQGSDLPKPGELLQQQHAKALRAALAAVNDFV